MALALPHGGTACQCPSPLKTSHYSMVPEGYDWQKLILVLAGFKFNFKFNLNFKFKLKFNLTRNLT